MPTITYDPPIMARLDMGNNKPDIPVKVYIKRYNINKPSDPLYVVDDPYLPGVAVYARESELSFEGDA